MSLKSEDKMLEEDGVMSCVPFVYVAVGNWFGFLSVNPRTCVRSWNNITTVLRISV
jgi:hypothetical protein